MKKFIFNVVFVLFVAAFAGSAYATYSVSACGYTFVKHDDGTWTVRTSTNFETNYSSAFTLADLKKEYCD